MTMLRSEEGDELILPVPAEKRRSTDVLCSFLLLGFWLCMTLIGLSSIGVIRSSYFKKGDPRLLNHGVDYEGNICGVSSVVSHLPKQVFPNFFGDNYDSKSTLVPTLTAICAASCPSSGDIVADPYGTYGTWTIQEDTVSFVNTCLYLSESRAGDSGASILSDFLHSYGVVAVLGFALAVGCSFVFLLITRMPLVLRTVIWTSVFLIFLICVGGGYFLVNEAKNQDEHRDSNRLNQTEVIPRSLLRLLLTPLQVQLLNGFGGMLIGVGILWLCITCFMRDRISLAINLIRESATVLTQLPLLLLLPFLQVAVFAAFTCLWLYYSMYLVSAGDISTHVDSTTGFSYKTISYSERSQQAILLMLFVWLWTIGFIEATGQIASSHAVLRWYFAPRRSEITSCQVLSSCLLTLRYHTGTAAVGSFLIAVFKFVRLALEYCKYQLSKHRHTSASSAVLGCSLHYRLMTCLLNCLNCTCFCVERWIQFLNKQAYIQVAMKGSGFFPSAYRAFKLLLRNLGRLAAVTLIGDIVVVIGKLFISLACATLGYLYMSTYLRSQLNGFILPTLLIFWLALVTSSIFLNVLSATAATLLQACLVDEELVKTGHLEGSQKGLRSLVIEHKEQWRSHEEYDRYDEEDLVGGEGDEDELNEIELQVQPPPKPPKPPKPSALGGLMGGHQYAMVDRDQTETALGTVTSQPTVSHLIHWCLVSNSPFFQANPPVQFTDGEVFNPAARNNRYAKR